MVSVSRTNRSRHRAKDDMSLVVLIAVVAGFFAFFLAAEAIFYLRPHPWHWLPRWLAQSWAMAQADMVPPQGRRDLTQKQP